jgi:hypothetical protein
VKPFNLNSDEWDLTRDREGWRRKGVGVAERIGGELIGATMSEVEPGSRLWPYHTHYLNEEWVIVLRGEPTLRTPEGEHVLKEGDVVELWDDPELGRQIRGLDDRRSRHHRAVACGNSPHPSPAESRPSVPSSTDVSPSPSNPPAALAPADRRVSRPAGASVGPAA